MKPDQSRHSDQSDLALEEDTMLRQTSFKLVAGETLLGSGMITHVKSVINIHRCDYNITNKRLILWSRMNGPVLTLFFPGIPDTQIAYLTGGNFTFQILWSRLAGISKGRHGLTGAVIFTMTDGQKIKLIYNGFGNQRSEFFGHIKAATGNEL